MVGCVCLVVCVCWQKQKEQKTLATAHSMHAPPPHTHKRTHLDVDGLGDRLEAVPVVLGARVLDEDDRVLGQEALVDLDELGAVFVQ